MQLRVNNAMIHKTKEGTLCCRQQADSAAGVFFPYTVLPGLADVHVHLREPGFSYKETIATGTAAAARGGYTDVCTMPNVKPVPDSLQALQQQLTMIEKDARIRVHPYGAITVGEEGKQLADLQAMAPFAVGFSDDGRGIQQPLVMKQAMKQAAALKKVIAAHCEDTSLLHGGYIHDGSYAAAHLHKGIVSRSEWGPIERDLALAKAAGCSYHVCHVSTAESVELIRKAKQEGVDVTCETAPHYLVLCDEDLQEDGRFKMNPPLRSRKDQQALLAGLKDGTIDMIATDHAPHSMEEKSGGLAGSLMGVVGLETAFPVLYTALVKNGIITLEQLTDKMCYAPRRRFGLPLNPEMDFCLYDLQAVYTIDPSSFSSKGRSTPFAGREVYGRCMATVCGGRVAWCDPELKPYLEGAAI